jgi:hypothetical protein
MAVNFAPECLYNVATWRSARVASTGSEKYIEAAECSAADQAVGSLQTLTVALKASQRPTIEALLRLNGLEAVKIGAGCRHGERELVMTCYGLGR